MMMRCAAVAVLLVLLMGCSAEDSPSRMMAMEENAPRDTVKAYLYYCGGCHGAPRPGTYTAAEWPAIVSRMQQRRLSARLGPVPPEQLRQILDYLQENAAGAPPR